MSSPWTQLRVVVAFLWGVGLPLWGAGGPLRGVGGDTGGEQLVRETSAGRVRGYLYHVTPLQASTERYLGIPFAAPPVGSLRLEPPQPPAAWSGVRNATELPPACWTVEVARGYVAELHMQGFTQVSEDCLFLNVYVPVLEHAPSSLPVLVHVHGGGNNAGMGAMLHPDVFALLAEVVVVNFNYRLGSLGFMGMGKEGFRGNFGLLDQNAALRWVKDNIRHFGGDPAKVTLQGHSAGGADVGCHMVSPASKGLFRYAILQSGSPLSYFGVEQAPLSILNMTLRIASEVGCDVALSPAAIKECLKMVSPERMVARAQTKYKGVYASSVIPITIDGEFLTEHPGLSMKEGRINVEAAMLGVTANDGGSWGLSRSPRFLLSKSEIVHALPPTDAVRNLPHVVDLVQFLYLPLPPQPNSSLSHARAQGDIVGDSAFRAPGLGMADVISPHVAGTHFYSFDFDSPLTEAEGVYHGDDLFYLWGYPFVGHFLYNYSDLERDVSREMAALWGSFVRTGHPRSRQGRKLSPYTFSRPAYFRVAASQNGSVVVEQSLGLRMRHVEFWNWLLPRLGRKKRGRDLDALTTVFICLSAVLCLALAAVSVAFYMYCRRRNPAPTRS